MTEHPLSDLNVLPEPALAALRGRWIETAEQLLALAATPEGRAGAERILGLDARAFDAVLARLAKVVGPALQSDLARPAPGGKLGLILPEPNQDECPGHE